MAVGCWQPYHPADNPYGDVHLFRMSLWAALLRHHDPVFRFPGTIECVHRVKTLIHHNWTEYIRPEGSVTPGILLPYPINVLPDGSLENLAGVTQSHDFKQGSRVSGQLSRVITAKLYT